MKEYKWLFEALSDLQVYALENKMPHTAAMFSEAITLAHIDIQMNKIAEINTCEDCKASVMSALRSMSAIVPIPLAMHEGGEDVPPDQTNFVPL